MASGARREAQGGITAMNMFFLEPYTLCLEPHFFTVPCLSDKTQTSETRNVFTSFPHFAVLFAARLC